MKQQSMSCTQEKKLMDTFPKKTQMLDLTDKEIKSAIIKC